MLTEENVATAAGTANQAVLDYLDALPDNLSRQGDELAALDVRLAELLVFLSIPPLAASPPARPRFTDSVGVLAAHPV
jgi:hypothetical protein